MCGNTGFILPKMILTYTGLKCARRKPGLGKPMTIPVYGKKESQHKMELNS